MKPVLKYTVVGLAAMAIGAPTVEAAATWTTAQAKVIAGIKNTNKTQNTNINTTRNIVNVQASTLSTQASTLSTLTTQANASPSIATNFSTVSANGFAYLSVFCPLGKHVTGGGMQTSDPKVVLSSSYPGGGSYWAVEVLNLDSSLEFFTVYAVCR